MLEGSLTSVYWLAGLSASSCVVHIKQENLPLDQLDTPESTNINTNLQNILEPQIFSSHKSDDTSIP